MEWGLPWGSGSLWGLLTGPGPEEFCELAQDRVLIQMDDAPSNRKFRDLICILVEGLGEYRDVALDVAAAFDLDAAIGVQLDAIGAVVGLPRQGYPDDRYRTFLRIQIDLLLGGNREGGNWTGTHNNILSIVRTFIGPGPDPIILTNYAPYSFTLSIPGLDPAEIPILRRFLCIALYAAVLGQSIFTVADNSLWDSESVGPIPNGGIWCSGSVVVPDCATWGFAVITGGACP